MALSYKDYFNMGSYTVDHTINPFGEPIKSKRKYSEEILPITIHNPNHIKEETVYNHGIPVQEDVEPTPMVETSWENAYPKGMLTPDDEKELYMHPDDLAEYNKAFSAVELSDESPVNEIVESEEAVEESPIEEVTEESSVEEVVAEEIPVEVTTATPVEDPVEEAPVEEKPVVKKRNPRRTKKNK